MLPVHHSSITACDDSACNREAITKLRPESTGSFGEAVSPFPGLLDFLRCGCRHDMQDDLHM